MSRLSNVREILQFHYCNVTLYTEKETDPQGQNRAVCFVTTAHFLFIYFFYYYYFFFFYHLTCGSRLKSCETVPTVAAVCNFCRFCGVPEVQPAEDTQTMTHARSTINDTCQIYLCNMSPRSDTDTTEVNQVIDRLCEEHNLTMVDINKAFYDKRGKIIERYYGDDLIHLSTSGVKRLLGEIDKEINIVENFENCSFKSRYQKRSHVHKGSSQTNSHRSNSGPRRGRPTKNRENKNANSGAACYKCGETNHETSRCKHKEQLKCYYCGFYGHKSGRCLNQ